ncbi:MAG: DUF6898 family protein [Rhizomicrobium sp.]
MSGRVRDKSSKGQEILVEFIAHGNTVKVTAVDAASGIEASIVAPASAPRAILEANVARKLSYVIKKQQRAV